MPTHLDPTDASTTRSRVSERGESAPSAAGPAPATRAEIARRRTERTRRRLLDATLRVWTDNEDSSEQAVIRQVVEVADVSRATFYKHFPSLEKAAAALGSRLSDEMVDALRPIQDAVASPLLRASLGIQLFLWRAMMDKRWARFVSRSHHVIVSDSHFMRHVSDDLISGLNHGEFDIERLDVALAVNHGALKEGMSALSGGVDRPGAFISNLAKMILISFGVPRPKALDAVRQGNDQLMRQAPIIYDWWTLPASDQAAQHG